MTDIRDEVAAALLESYGSASATTHTTTDLFRVQTDDLLAALAARGLTVVREGELDVERLARALHVRGSHSFTEFVPPLTHGNWSGVIRTVACTVECHMDEAEAIAAEYARLARQPEGPR